MEGLTFGGAYLRHEKKKKVFALFYFVFEGNYPSTSHQGAYIWRGDLTEGFLRYRFGGLIFGGAYTWRGLFSKFYGKMIDNKKVFIVFHSLIPSLPLKCFCFHHHLLFHFLLFQRKYRRLLMMISEQQHSIAHLFLDSGRPATELLRSSSVLLKNGLQSLPFSPQHPYDPEQGDLLNKGVTLQLFALPKMKKR